MSYFVVTTPPPPSPTHPRSVSVTQLTEKYHVQQVKVPHQRPEDFSSPTTTAWPACTPTTTPHCQATSMMAAPATRLQQTSRHKPAPAHLHRFFLGPRSIQIHQTCSACQICLSLSLPPGLSRSTEHPRHRRRGHFGRRSDANRKTDWSNFDYGEPMDRFPHHARSDGDSSIKPTRPADLEPPTANPGSLF